MFGQTKKDIASEDELLSRLVASEECAWRIFYRMIVSQLVTFAEHRGAVDPEDIVQDAMLRFLTVLREGHLHLDTIDDACAYLTTLVRNLVIDSFRRNKARCRDVTVSLDEFMIPVPAMAPLIVEAKEVLAMREVAQKTLSSFWMGSDKAKFVYASCVLQGRSVREVAAELGIPPNTVSQMKRRYLKKVHQLSKRVA